MLDLQHHLAKTSRTFALAIKLLDKELRREVTIAYLLLRIADTLEDADLWPPERRIIALAQLDLILGVDDEVEAKKESARWLDSPPCENEDYLALLAVLPEVMEEGRKLAPTAWETIVRHVRRTIQGMMSCLSRDGYPSELRLRSTNEVRGYCYIVAGIVGELLTELFVWQGHVSPSYANKLWQAARFFGEGLQLVNILKDEADDASVGRSFLPPNVDRSELFALARADLAIADGYVKALRQAGASFGLLGFTMLPLRLARHTLDRVEQKGAGAKLSREEVRVHLEEVSSLTLRPEA